MGAHTRTKPSILARTVLMRSESISITQGVSGKILKWLLGSTIKVICLQSVITFTVHQSTYSYQVTALAQGSRASQVPVVCAKYRCLDGTARHYLAETIQPVSSRGTRQHLRSAETSTLLVPSTRRSTLSDRSFPVPTARAWNALPQHVQNAPSLSIFRRELKTVLFQSSFPDVI